ncbi:MAG TPA: hypothetical protein DDW49_10470 [Deltaproteobacteria bacterium]|nr:MAG: hypothetical protein A2048_06045 [Deltaproteobacteria bacterium GWA2_45_12]HBF13786.1 hypothetical protein [Deltaproteobacteria bacterium]
MRYLNLLKKLPFILLLVLPLKIAFAHDGNYVHDKEYDGNADAFELNEYDNQRETAKQEKKRKEKDDLDKMNKMKVEVKDKDVPTQNDRNTIDPSGY